MTLLYRTPLLLEPQPEGGWTVTCPVLPELITELDNLRELNAVASDALSAVIELYKEMGKEIPRELVEESDAPVRFESLVLAEA